MAIVSTTAFARRSPFILNSSRVWLHILLTSFLRLGSWSSARALRISGSGSRRCDRCGRNRNTGGIGSSISGSAWSDYFYFRCLLTLSGIEHRGWRTTGLGRRRMCSRRGRRDRIDVICGRCIQSVMFVSVVRGIRFVIARSLATLVLVVRRDLMQRNLRRANNSSIRGKPEVQKHEYVSISVRCLGKWKVRTLR